MGTILYRTLMITCALCLCSGCTQSLNDRITLGGSFRSPSFVDHSATPSNNANANSQLIATRKETGVETGVRYTDRSQWSPVQYVSPMDGVVHTRLWRVLHPVSKKDPPRTYGRFPLTSNVLDMQSTKALNDTLNTIDDIGRAFIGTPFALGYMTVTGSITKPALSPVSVWKRTNTTNTWSSGFPTPAKEAAQEAAAESRAPSAEKEIKQ